jgi:hypothetical protein
MIIRLFLSKRKSTYIVSKACRNKLACLILVVVSCKRAYNRRGFKSKLLDVNIYKP